MSEQPEPEAEAETIDVDALFETALEKAKEVVTEADDFTRGMRRRAMACRELASLADVRGRFGEHAVGEHIDAIDEAIVRVCARIGED